MDIKKKPIKTMSDLAPRKVTVPTASAARSKKTTTGKVVGDKSEIRRAKPVVKKAQAEGRKTGAIETVKTADTRVPAAARRTAAKRTPSIVATANDVMALPPQLLPTDVSLIGEGVVGQNNKEADTTISDSDTAGLPVELSALVPTGSDEGTNRPIKTNNSEFSVAKTVGGLVLGLLLIAIVAVGIVLVYINYYQ